MAQWLAFNLILLKTEPSRSIILKSQLKKIIIVIIITIIIIIIIIIII